MRNGPSLYYASDKNIFDALNQSKVNLDVVQTLFRRRNVVCSKKTKREQLAEFFSRLTHDLNDHRELSNALGIVARRERITSVDLVGAPPDASGLQSAIDALRDKLVKEGCIVNIHHEGASSYIAVRYTVIDYKKSEFSQLQERTGTIEVVLDSGKMVVRSTKSDFLDIARDDLVREIIAETPNPLSLEEISLQSLPSPNVRSQFFYDLMADLPGYERKDVTGVFVFKPRPDSTDDFGSDVVEEDTGGDEEPHVERIWLKGSSVAQADVFKDLTSADIENPYYIAKVTWVSQMKMGSGAAYEIEATFSDPKNCTGFSYLLRGVYDRGDDLKLSKLRRAPLPSEINMISLVVENKARGLLKDLMANL